MPLVLFSLSSRIGTFPFNLISANIFHTNPNLVKLLKTSILNNYQNFALTPVIVCFTWAFHLKINLKKSNQTLLSGIFQIIQTKLLPISMSKLYIDYILSRQF